MDTFKKTQDRLRQNLWDIRTNNGTAMTAVHSTTGEVFNGTTAAFNAIFNAKPTVDADADIVRAKSNPLTGGIVNLIWNGTQAQYDAIAVKDASTLYVIVG